MDYNKQLKITISGFGPFGDVKINPTNIIVSKFTEEFKQKYNIVHSEVIEASEVACKKYVNSLPINTLNIHFGLNKDSKEFNIEQFGYNLKDFISPDEKGYCPTDEPIEYNQEKDFRRKTKINTELLVEELQEQFLVVESTNPGRFVCNLIYYLSLLKSQGCSCSSCLFVHFPTFSTISKEIQMDFVEYLLETLHQLHYMGDLFQ